MTHTPENRKAALDALRADPWRLGPLARLFGVAHSTLLRWARQEKLELPSPRARMSKASQVVMNHKWPAWEKRRQIARHMRADGATLEQIRDACAYRSIAAAHYAAKPIQT